jgi:putative glutamate/gamma-aminobutyrate antiporter
MGLESTTRHVPRTLTVFMLAMINLAAIGGVKNWPILAEYGFSSFFFLLLAAVVFFIPVSLVAAELATGWPKLGGVYAWVKEAFGHRTGFLSIWFLWVENVIWYPTILSFIAATLAYVIDPALSQNTGYTIAVILVMFWAMTLINMFGMRVSGWVSTLGAVTGTLLPGALIIILGCLWFLGDNPIQFTVSWDSFFPDMTNITQLVFFTGVMLSYAGIEMSAIHARDVKDPQRDYPRALLLSVVLILGLYSLGALSLAAVVPQKDITLTAGSMQAFEIFLGKYGLKTLVPMVAFLVFIGAMGSLSTWIIGPCKGLLAAAQGGDLPPTLRKINHKGIPVPMLILQGVIVTVLSLVFVLMPTVSSAFWILSALVTQVYLLMYILMFAAAIRLRYTHPKTKRTYKIPGGKAGVWIVCGFGILSSIFTLVIGFFPPAQIQTGNYLFYFSFLIIGIIVVCLSPYVILLFKKPSWNHPLSND